jgi:hypothetical protein
VRGQQTYCSQQTHCSKHTAAAAAALQQLQPCVGSACTCLVLLTTFNCAVVLFIASTCVDTTKSVAVLMWSHVHLRQYDADCRCVHAKTNILFSTI